MVEIARCSRRGRRCDTPAAVQRVELDADLQLARRQHAVLDGVFHLLARVEGAVRSPVCVCVCAAERRSGDRGKNGKDQEERQLRVMVV